STSGSRPSPGNNSHPLPRISTPRELSNAIASSPSGAVKRVGLCCKLNNRHYCHLPNGPGRSSALSQDKELENLVMQIIEIINPIFEFLRKLAVANDIGHSRFET